MNKNVLFVLGWESQSGTGQIEFRHLPIPVFAPASHHVEHGLTKVASLFLPHASQSITRSHKKKHFKRILPQKNRLSFVLNEFVGTYGVIESTLFTLL